MSRSVRLAALLGAQVLLSLVGAAGLLWPAFDNGFPLSFQDSAWYLGPIYGAPVHPGRAVGYFGLAWVSFAASPSVWSLVAAQALVTSALLVRVCFVFAQGLGAGLVLAATALCVLVVGSGAAKYVSWVMADVTTSWLFLAGVLWMLSRQVVDRMAACAVLLFAAISHSTHVPLVLATAAGVGVAAFALPGIGRAGRRASLGLLALALFAAPFTIGVNAVFGSPSLVRGASSHLMDRFVDTGVLTRTLSLYCDERRWRVCRYQDAIAARVGRGGGYYLFHPDSPFRELGAWDDEEQSEIVAHALRCCSVQIVGATLLGAWEQLWSIDSDYGLRPSDSGSLLLALRNYLPGEAIALSSSRQRRGDTVRVLLHPFPEVWLQAGLGLVGLLAAAVAWRDGARAAPLLLGSTWVFLIANAVVCSAGGDVFDRYQGRVAWLLPFSLTFVGFELVRVRVAKPGESRTG